MDKGLKMLKERQEKGLCPICLKKLDKQETDILEYKDTEFIVCKRHIK